MKLIKFFYHTFRNIFDNCFASIICFFQNEKVLNELYEKCSLLFITHSFGGGTKTYENNYLQSKTNAFIMRNVRGFKTHYVTLNKFNSKNKFYLNKRNLSEFFNKLNKTEIIVSSIVPYTNYKEIFKSVIKYKKKNNFYVCYLIHDFHCICPNFTILADDIYCNLECSKNKCKLNNININDWRPVWKQFFFNIDEIRVFSSSSKDLILKAYPDLQKNKINIVPHDMSYCNYRPYKIRREEPTRVAIVGTCDTIAKGNKIINDLLSCYNGNEVILFGKTPLNNKARQNRCVINFGPYKHPDLPIQMEKYNVDTVIFPSVCPETFSYTISELIALGVKIVCFDIGAQAEKVKKYNKGFVVKEITIQSLMNTLNKTI